LFRLIPADFVRRLQWAKVEIQKELKMKLLLFAIGLFALFAIVVPLFIFRAFTAKPSLPPNSPLAQAVFDGDTDKVRSLLKDGADANSTLNATYQIAPDGNISASFSVPIFGAAQQEAGMSVLSFAAMQGSADIIRLLLDKGAEINSRDKYGQTPLILAAWQGDTESVQSLLNAHADVTARDGSGQTALMWAQMEGHSAVAEVLKRAGAKE
jgi:ankyrin repeat protein